MSRSGSREGCAGRPHSRYLRDGAGRAACKTAPRPESPRSTAVVAEVTSPRLKTLAAGDGSDHERGGAVGPPPSKESVRAKADEQGDREVGTDHVLLRFADGGTRPKGVTDPSLRPSEQRHGRCGDPRVADATSAITNSMTCHAFPPAREKPRAGCVRRGGGRCGGCRDPQISCVVARTPLRAAPDGTGPQASDARCGLGGR
jgi:hypothetical protein